VWQTGSLFGIAALGPPNNGVVSKTQKHADIQNANKLDKVLIKFIPTKWAIINSDGISRNLHEWHEWVVGWQYSDDVQQSDVVVTAIFRVSDAVWEGRLLRQGSSRLHQSQELVSNTHTHSLSPSQGHFYVGQGASFSGGGYLPPPPTPTVPPPSSPIHLFPPRFKS